VRAARAAPAAATRGGRRRPRFVIRARGDPRAGWSRTTATSRRIYASGLTDSYPKLSGSRTTTFSESASRTRPATSEALRTLTEAARRLAGRAKRACLVPTLGSTQASLGPISPTRGVRAAAAALNAEGDASDRCRTRRAYLGVVSDPAGSLTAQAADSLRVARSVPPGSEPEDPLQPRASAHGWQRAISAAGAEWMRKIAGGRSDDGQRASTSTRCAACARAAIGAGGAASAFAGGPSASRAAQLRSTKRIWAAVRLRGLLSRPQTGAAIAGLDGARSALAEVRGRSQPANAERVRPPIAPVAGRGRRGTLRGRAARARTKPATARSAPVPVRQKKVASSCPACSRGPSRAGGPARVGRDSRVRSAASRCAR
jgi:hypothetical protein